MTVVTEIQSGAVSKLFLWSHLGYQKKKKTNHPKTKTTPMFCFWYWFLQDNVQIPFSKIKDREYCTFSSFKYFWAISKLLSKKVC